VEGAPEANVSPPEAAGPPTSRVGWVARWRRYWPFIKWVLGLGIVALAVYVVSSHTGELSGLSKVFAHLHWAWVPPAILVEVASFGGFTGMQYQLLKAGGLRSPKLPLFDMTFGAQAIANSLPGGTAASAVYAFRWFRRFGADATLATWSLAGTLVASVVSLSLVATAGVALAADQGSSLDLIPVILGALLVTVAIGALFVYERPLVVLMRWTLRVSRKLTGRPRGDQDQHIERVIAWVSTVRLGWRQVGRILAWGLSNWILDCACFAMMFLAIGAGIPWRGLLLAYGAGQLAATLPVTPGGLGAVEGSITIALVEFGGSHTTTLDAVLMYRLISFWMVLVIGWALAGVLALQVRRGRFRRDILEAPAEAGADPALEPQQSAAALS
jgi:uncharacterized protein (TIRG00374 family)